MNLLSRIFCMFRKEKVVDYFTFARFVKYQKRIGDPVVPKDVKKLENFSTSIGVPFTARAHAQNLLSTLPNVITALRSRAGKALKWWSDISKGAKIFAIILAVGTFLFMAKLWWAPFVEFLKDLFNLTVSLIESCWPVIYVAGPVALIYYATKRYAKYRNEQLLDRAREAEDLIPEIEENSKLLN